MNACTSRNTIVTADVAQRRPRPKRAHDRPRYRFPNSHQNDQITKCSFHRVQPWRTADCSAKNSRPTRKCMPQIAAPAKDNHSQYTMPKEICWRRNRKMSGPWQAWNTADCGAKNTGSQDLRHAWIHMKWLFFANQKPSDHMDAIWSHYDLMHDFVSWERMTLSHMKPKCVPVSTNCTDVFFKDGKQGILTHKLYDVSWVKPGFNFLLP